MARAIDLDGPGGLEACCALLAEGAVVACPTETLVGLVADATNAAAVERVAQIKGRSDESPISVLVPDAVACARVAQPFGAIATRLALAHWPGPLTLVVPARDGIHRRLVKDGFIGLRVPGQSLAGRLVSAFGGPLTATSANVSGEPAVTDTRAR